ncbi:MAG: hypothetical protein ACO1OK_07585 [Devosia sp.]
MDMGPHRDSRAVRLLGQATVLLGLMVSSLVAGSASAMDLPDSTRLVLKELKLDESALTGLDKELTVPDAWIEGAKREGTFRIGGSWDPGQFRTMTRKRENRQAPPDAPATQARSAAAEAGIDAQPKPAE